MGRKGRRIVKTHRLIVSLGTVALLISALTYVPASVHAATPTAGTALQSPDGTNGGTFGRPPAGLSVTYPPDPGAAQNAAGDGLPEAQAQAQGGPRVSAAAAGLRNCQGAFYNVVSNVYFRMLSGRLNWDFYLTHEARALLGSPVTVSMPFALINGRAINPPYGPHTRPNTYDFHATMRTYTFIGDGTHTIRAGDKLTMYWLIIGSPSSGKGAYRYITCRIP